MTQHHKTLVVVLPAILFCLAGVGEAHAQAFTTRGLVLGLGVGGAAVTLENTPTDGAGLVGGRIGYGFNRVLTIYATAYDVDADIRELDGFDKVTCGHADIGMRLHLAAGRRRSVPYGDVAITFWPVTDILKNGEQTTTDFRGAASSLGGGLVVYLTDALAVLPFRGGAPASQQGGSRWIPTSYMASRAGCSST